MGENDLRTEDLWPDVVTHIGQERHLGLIDLIVACQTALERRVLSAVKLHENYTEAAQYCHMMERELTSSYRRLRARANRCRNENCLHSA